MTDWSRKRNWSDFHDLERDYPDGRVGIVLMLTFNRARLVVAPFRGAMEFLDGW
jgi:hypothetical protein